MLIHIFYCSTLSSQSYIQEELDDIIHDDPNSGTTCNTNEDALTKLFGNPTSGRLIGEGRGISRSKLTILNMSGDKITMLEQQQQNMKIQIAEVLNLVKEHLVMIRSCTCITIKLYY